MKKLIEIIKGLEQYQDAGWTGINDYYRPCVADALELLRVFEARHRLEVHNIGNVDIPEGVSWEQFQAVMENVVDALEHTDRGESWPYAEAKALWGEDGKNKDGEVGMMDREKVINGLEEVQHYINVENLPAHTLKAKLVINDAIALLKAQEPRVMTLEEIKALPDYVFLEDRDISHAFSIKTISRPALPQLVFVNTSGEECMGFRGPDGDTSLVTSRYGVEWRCWTSRPDEKRRAETPWQQ